MAPAQCVPAFSEPFASFRLRAFVRRGCVSDRGARTQARRPPDWKCLLARQAIVREFQGYEAADLAAVSGYFMLVRA